MTKSEAIAFDVDGLSQAALASADIGIARLERARPTVLRGSAEFSAHLDLARTPAVAIELDDAFSRLGPADQAQLNALTAAWISGTTVKADLSVNVSAENGLQRTVQIRLFEHAHALLLMTMPEKGAQQNVLRAASHALRSPLNALLGWVHVLAMKRAQDEEVVGIAARLERSAKALLRTVNDLQDLDHLKRGKFKLETRSFKLAESIEAAVQAVAETAGLREIRLVSRFRLECDSSIEGDPLRLRQLFEHLLRNAIHHSNQGAQICVRCERTDSQLEIRIEDTGTGLTNEQIETLFGSQNQEIPFESPGLGAGLKLSKEIVKRHRGHLGASSAGPGTGLTVLVTLPVRPTGHTSEGQKKRADRTQPANGV